MFVLFRHECVGTMIQHHTCRHVIPLEYIILIQSQQSLPSFFNAASLAEKQKTPVYSHRFDSTGARTYDLAHAS